MPLPNQPSDEDLVRASRTGDPDALGVIWRRHGPALVGFATRMLGVAEEAEDVASEAMTQLMRGRWRDQGRVKAWLSTVVHRACIDKLRRRQRWARVVHLIGVSRPVPPVAHRALEHRDDVDALERALQTLPESHRATVLLYYGQSLSSAEVAEAMNCSDQQVRSRLSYARRKLRETLKEDAWTR